MTLEIIIKEPSLFFGSKDEAVFFRWLKSIKAIQTFVGVRQGLKLTVSSPIPDEGLMDLISLFSRYQLNLRPLHVFCTPENEIWFRNHEKYWYDAVFGDSDTS